MNPPDERLVIGTWLLFMLLIVAALAFFYLSGASAKVKQRVFYWYTGIGGVLILFWFWLLAGLGGLLIGIPLYVVAAAIALHTTRFCHTCGRTLMNQFTPAKFCPRCGAELNGSGDDSTAK